MALLKKIGFYLGLCTLGLALGCSNPETANNKPLADNPAKVRIENAYFHRYEEAKPTCIYSSNDRLSVMAESPEKTIYLKFDMGISDEDIIKHMQYGWHKPGSEPPFSDSYKNKSKNKETSLSVSSGGYHEKHLREFSFEIKVTDWKGNVKEMEFTLDQILKDSRPMKTKPMRLIDGKLECDERF